jgi:hypothetical protein
MGITGLSDRTAARGVKTAHHDTLGDLGHAATFVTLPGAPTPRSTEQLWASEPRAAQLIHKSRSYFVGIGGGLAPATGGTAEIFSASS